jgi:hypothetical protein
MNGLLVPNYKEQGVLRLFRVNGFSYRAIANKLNDEHLPSKNGGTWHPFSVQKVLRTSEVWLLIRNGGRPGT